MTGTWRNAKTDVPRDGVQVLCIKELKNARRTMCFGSHWKDRQYDDGWVTGGGNNNVIMWMTLPEIPEGDVPARMMIVQDAEGMLKDCVNELCLKCGKYHEEHRGACDGCRWLKPRRGW
ncbi:MAG: hypothetical protein IKG23_08580 [Clostridia bacterium]|nr:hypothetical protein [Clostridia bacterium]